MIERSDRIGRSEAQSLWLGMYNMVRYVNLNDPIEARRMAAGWPARPADPMQTEASKWAISHLQRETTLNRFWARP